MPLIATTSLEDKILEGFHWPTFTVFMALGKYLNMKWAYGIKALSIFHNFCKLASYNKPLL